MSSVTGIVVSMFSVADQDSVIAFYTRKLGWELRSDVSWDDPDGDWVWAVSTAA